MGVKEIGVIRQGDRERKERKWEEQIKIPDTATACYTN